MYVPEIIEVKDHLEKLKTSDVIKAWELPYENILTRRSAAIFFVSLHDTSSMPTVAKELGSYDNFSYRKNEEKKLSQLDYRITFSKEEKEKNEAVPLDHPG